MERGERIESLIDKTSTLKSESVSQRQQRNACESGACVALSQLCVALLCFALSCFAMEQRGDGREEQKLAEVRIPVSPSLPLSLSP